MRSQAERIRLRHVYRRLVLRGGTRLSPRVAIRLVGPDCAYHLYRHARGQRGGGTLHCPD